MPRTKLDPYQFTPDITPLALAELAELVGELGVPAERLSVGMGINAADLHAGALVSNHQAWRLLRRAIQLTGRTDLGLELGRRQNLSHFGLPGFAMASARTLADAVEIGVRYQDQGGSLVDISFEIDGEQAALIGEPRLHDALVQVCVIEELFASLAVLIRHLLGGDYRPQAIELAYPAPLHALRYQELFACPIRFAQPRSRLILLSRWLELPLLGHSSVAAAALRTLLEERARHHQAPNTVAAVEHVLKQAGGAARSVEQVAAALDLSPRTLRRRLRETGISFRALNERRLAEQAQHLLRDEGLTVAEAGKRLGFSDARAFRRAFKRWLCEVPGAVRQRPQA